MDKPATGSQAAPAQTPTTGTIPPPIPAWLVAVLLALATLALYWPATRCDFINYDDPSYVTTNPHVQGGLNWESVAWAFGHPVSANWHPLTVMSHMLDCQLFGLHPRGHHLVNILLHSCNAALVFVLLRQLTGAMWRSLFVAALFAVHPLRVESVAWVSERKDVLSGCFGLLALVFYAGYARKSKVKALISPDYWFSLFFFALGLLSKPILVTWPFVMLLLDYWPLERFDPRRAWRLVMEKVPFFILAAAASCVTFAVQKQGGSLAMNKNLLLDARIGNALVSYCRYLGKTFWPIDLAVFYPHPGHWPRAEVLLAGGLLAGLSAFFWGQRRRYPFLLMGWLWFIGMLVPVIGLVQTGEQALADRHTYLPSLGVFIMVSWGSYELTRRWRHQVQGLSLAGSVAIILCVAVTRQQLGYWQDSETLFRHALAVTENNYLAHNSLGYALFSKNQIGEAISEYREAIRLNPDDAMAHFDLGAALVQTGQIDEAISEYRKAIRLKPDFAKAYTNLGAALGRNGQIDEAVSQLQTAIRLEPDNADAYNDLGLAFSMNGQINEAINQFQTAIRLKPDGAEAHNNLGIVLVRENEIDEAISQFQEAIRLKPDYAKARNNLARALEIKNSPASR